MPPTRFPFETDQSRVDVTLPIGTHVLELVVVDSAGIASEPDRVTITVEREQVARIDSITPNSAVPGERFQAVIRGSGLRGATAIRFTSPDTTLDLVGARIIDSTLDDRLVVDVTIADVQIDPDFGLSHHFQITTEDGTVLDSSQVGVEFHVVPPQDRIDGITPSSALAGRTVDMTVTGRGLRGANQVVFSNAEIVRVPSATINSEQDDVLTFQAVIAPIPEGPVQVSFTVRTPETLLDSREFGVLLTVIVVVFPTVFPTPTIGPTISPTIRPTISPTILPTISPTISPTIIPTIIPTISPTLRPTISPTFLPVRPVNEVPGIGRVSEARLAEAGIESLEDLAKAEASDVAEALSASEVRAGGLIQEARRLLDS